jgi:hypothetical protein
MCLNETYGEVRMGKFPIQKSQKQRNALSPLVKKK